MPDKVTQFEIDRRKWLRGEGGTASRLLRSDGKMCCLGFYLRACGVEEAALQEQRTPCSLALDSGPEIIPDEAKWLFYENFAVQALHSGSCENLISDNDRKKGDEDYESTREQGITTTFLRHGIKVIFTN